MTGDRIATNQELVGTVLAVQANFYRVQLHGGLIPTLLCTRRTRLKKIGQQVMVGDQVLVEEPDWMGGRGAIADVLPRKTELDRPAIANVNQILLVFAVANPPLEPVQLSRFLVKGESTGIDLRLCLNTGPYHELRFCHLQIQVQANYQYRCGEYSLLVILRYVGLVYRLSCFQLALLR